MRTQFENQLSELLDKHMALHDSNKELIEVLSDLNISLDVYWNAGRSDNLVKTITEFQKASSEILTRARRL